MTLEKNISLDETNDNNQQEDVTDFEQIVDKMLSRRGFIGGATALGTSAFLMSTGLLNPKQASAASRLLEFEPIAANTLDTVTVPRGYSWHVVASWGDPLWSDGTWFNHTTRGTGASQEKAVGDNTDAMILFNHEGHSILTVNQEYTNRQITYGNRDSKLPENADDVRKGKAAHGVTVMEIKQENGR